MPISRRPRYHDCKSNLCETPHYEDSVMPDVYEMKCPIGTQIACLVYMDRPTMHAHINDYHPHEDRDVERYFEAEAERRAGLN